MGMRVDLARMQAVPALQPPSPMHSATFAVVSAPSFSESPQPVQQEGRCTEEQKRKGEAAAETGEGGDKGGQAVASGEEAEVAAAGAERKGEERGEHAATRTRADPFHMAEGDTLGGSVVDNILVVSEDEGEGAGRMAVGGGQRQLTAPNVPAAAMKSILPEVRRRGEGKSRQGRAGAGAAEGRDSGVRTGGQDQTSKGRKGRAGASGARDATRHREEKGGKGGWQGREWLQPQTLVQAAAAGVAPTGQRGAAGGGGERADSRQRGTRRRRTRSASAVAARP